MSEYVNDAWPAGWAIYARAICESEGREWMGLDNSREDCERWFKAGCAVAALSAPAPSQSWDMEARDHAQHLVNLMTPDQGESASEAFGLALRLQALLEPR